MLRKIWKCCWHETVKDLELWTEEFGFDFVGGRDRD